MTERTVSVDLTAREIQVLTCAMAGNFPESLGDVRVPALRKLAKAHHKMGSLMDGIGLARADRSEALARPMPRR